SRNLRLSAHAPAKAGAYIRSNPRCAGSAFLDELLDPPAGADLSRVDVAFGIDCDFMKEHKLSSVSSDSSEAADFPECFTVKQVNAAVAGVSQKEELLSRIG